MIMIYSVIQKRSKMNRYKRWTRGLKRPGNQGAHFYLGPLPSTFDLTLHVAKLLIIIYIMILMSIGLECVKTTQFTVWIIAKCSPW